MIIDYFEAAKSATTVWGKAGVRRSPTEVAARRAHFAYKAQRAKARDERDQAEAYRLWRLGAMVPWRITHALDAGDHEGPEVDVACGAVEPAVDEWEAGRLYPTFDQVQLLAKLTGYPIIFFFNQEELIPIQHTTLWGHMTQRERDRYQPPIQEFDVDAPSVCPGTQDYEGTHLF